MRMGLRFLFDCLERRHHRQPPAIKARTDYSAVYGKDEEEEEEEEDKYSLRSVFNRKTKEEKQPLFALCSSLLPSYR